MSAKKLFREEEIARIEQAVKAAESRTSGEIVPVIHLSSGHYDWAGYRSALTFLLLTSLAMAAIFQLRPFAFDIWLLFCAQALSLLLGWELSRLPFVLRLLVGRRRMAEEVHQAARAAFAHYGVFNTKERSGVMIYLSLVERRVVILGDRGIHEHAGDAFWKAEVDKIVGGLSQGKSCEALVEAIGSIGKKLEAHFPPVPGKANELPDHVRFH